MVEIKNANIKLKYNEHVLNQAKEIVKIAYNINSNSVVFKPNKLPHDYYRSSPIAAVELFKPGSNIVPQQIQITEIDLYDLSVELREIKEFERMVHFDCKLYNPYKGEVKSCYRLSEEALRYTPTEHIVTELIRHLKQPLGH